MLSKREEINNKYCKSLTMESLKRQESMTLLEKWNETLELANVPRYTLPTVVQIKTSWPDFKDYIKDSQLRGYTILLVDDMDLYGQGKYNFYEYNESIGEV